MKGGKERGREGGRERGKEGRREKEYFWRIQNILHPFWHFNTKRNEEQRNDECHPRNQKSLGKEGRGRKGGRGERG